MANKITNVLAYIEEKSTPCPPSGCWLWEGGVNPSGYGVLGIVGRNQRAHRVSFEEFHGPIPDGMQVLHRCDVKSCVNPNHLYAGTSQDNANDRVKRGMGKKPRVEFCKRGHPTKEIGSRNKWGHCMVCYKELVKRMADAYANRKASHAKS